MHHLKVSGFGPIREADVTFGDLTFLVGQQASGKTLFLELFKLLEDRDAIISTLRKYNYMISRKEVSNLLDAFFGQGMSNIWRSETHIEYDNADMSSATSLLKPSDHPEPAERVFYIPAQRIFSISDGRPKAFSEFDPTTPYVLRQFSETLRIFMSTSLGGNVTLFPISTRLKKVQREAFNESIFHDGRVEIQTENGQRKMRLNVDGMNIPFMTWSAGQKEFMPLLMGFYCVSAPLMPNLNNDQYQYVVIEEPEMGLHPKAIMSVLFEVLQLIQTGKKVIISTHSTVPMEFAWAFHILKQSKKKHRESALFRLFDEKSKDTTSFRNIFDKDIRTYAFQRGEKGVTTVDISTLDAFDERKEIAEWGGLSSFATKTSDLVSQFCDE